MTELATELGVSLLLWLGTAWLHATCLLALVWLAERTGLLRHAGWREWAWRSALLLPLASAALQIAAGGMLPALRLDLPAAGVIVAAPVTDGNDVADVQVAARSPAPPASAAASPLPGHAESATPRVQGAVARGQSVDAARPPAAVADSALNSRSQLGARAAAALGLLWAAWALFVAARLARRWRREARRVAALPLLDDAGLSRERDVLCLGQPLRPRLRSDASLDGPAAWAPDSVCLPPWTLTALTAAQRRATLAHEIAHLLRRDPQWQLAARWLALLLPSPLSLLARRRLAELAEHACDGWAARHTGEGRALAESLLACAERRCAAPAYESLAVAMAAPRSPLVERIHLLVEDTPMQFDSAPTRRRGALIVGLLAAAVALPGFARQAEPEAPAAPSAPSAPSAPPAPAPAAPSPPSPPSPPAFDGEIDYTQSDWLFGRSSRLSIRQPGYELAFEADGDFAFNASEDDLLSLDDTLSIEETRDGVTRRIDFTDRSDGFARSYAVEGAAREFDAEGKQWLASLLPHLLRETGIDAEVREERIFRAGGADAVLAEIALIRGEHARNRYLGLLLQRSELDAAQLGRVIAEVRRLNGDYELRVALSRVLKHGALDAAGMAGVLAMAGGIESDYERRVVLQRAARRMPADAGLHAAWLDALDGMDSDYEQRVALQELLERASLQPELLVKAAEAIDRIDADYEQRVALESLAEQAGGRPEVLLAYAGALRHIGSDYERRVAVQAVLERAPVDAAGASALLDAIEGIGADYERRVALTSLAARMPADAAVIARYRVVARSLGTHERGEAEAALDHLVI